MSDIHSAALRESLRDTRFIHFTKFEPLDVDEFRTLTQSDAISAMDDDQIERLWIKPVSRWLQQFFRIDQRNYSTDTDPTLAELTEDFKIAVTLCIDKWSRNEADLTGSQSVDGVGTLKWDHSVPPRARQLLKRYSAEGGGVARA